MDRSTLPAGEVPLRSLASQPFCEVTKWTPFTISEKVFTGASDHDNPPEAVVRMMLSEPTIHPVAASRKKTSRKLIPNSVYAILQLEGPSGGGVG